MTSFKFSTMKFVFIFVAVVMFLHLVPGYFHFKTALKSLYVHEKCQVNTLNDKIVSRYQGVNDYISVKEVVKNTPYKVSLIEQRSGRFLISQLDNIPRFLEDQITVVNSKEVWRKSKIVFDEKHVYWLYINKQISYTGIIQEAILLFVYNLISLSIVSFLIINFSNKLYKRINKNMDHFFKDIIHDIRTPIGVLQLNLERLEGVMPKEKAVQRSQAAIKTLITLYDQMEYALKKDYVKYKREYIDLYQFVLARVEFFQIFADLKNIELKTKLDENITVWMNRIELQRLIDNNLSNSIKYAHDKTTVEIKLLHGKKNNITLDFKNKGEVIKDVDSIFNRFVRNKDFDISGHGIGLDIVRNICNKYKIDVNVSSNNEENLFSYKFKNSE